MTYLVVSKYLINQNVDLIGLSMLLCAKCTFFINLKLVFGKMFPTPHVI